MQTMTKLNQDAEPSAIAPVRVQPVVGRLQSHVAMMAPHQRERHAGKLIIEATERIVILEQFVASLLNPEENGYAVTGYVRDQARMLLGEKPCEVKPPNAESSHAASATDNGTCGSREPRRGQ